jgi:hypothetical protein
MPLQYHPIWSVIFKSLIRHFHVYLLVFDYRSWAEKRDSKLNATTCIQLPTPALDLKHQPVATPLRRFCSVLKGRDAHFVSENCQKRKMLPG